MNSYEESRLTLDAIFTALKEIALNKRNSFTWQTHKEKITIELDCRCGNFSINYAEITDKIKKHQS